MFLIFDFEAKSPKKILSKIAKIEKKNFFGQFASKSKIKNICNYEPYPSDPSFMDFLPYFDIAHFSFSFEAECKCRGTHIGVPIYDADIGVPIYDAELNTQYNTERAEGAKRPRRAHCLARRACYMQMECVGGGQQSDRGERRAYRCEHVTCESM